MMRSPALLFALLFGLSAITTGCSAESKASAALAKHEGAFRVCKEEMDKMKAAHWEHRCTLVASMALDASLADSGLDEARARRMRDDWLRATGYEALYVPADKRAAPPATAPNPGTTATPEHR
jgi:hypothetical protein